MRIDKCMECRQSLFAPEEPKSIMRTPYSRGSNASYSFTEARSGRRPSNVHNNINEISERSIVPKPIRLPLPKNMVLMSLIESSEMTKVSSYKTPQTIMLSSGFKGDNNEEEDDRILMGTDMTTSTCGTYVVRKKQGLKLVQQITEDQICPVDSSWKTDVDSIMKNASHESSTVINYGDRVQVVNIVDKWAKLARGYGYVYLENVSDLVKVGGPLDKACSMEAWICALSRSRNRLIEAKNGIEQDSFSLMSRLRETLEIDEDLTVIAAEAFNFTRSKSTDEKNDGRDDTSSKLTSGSESTSSSMFPAGLIRQGESDGAIEVVLPSEQSNFLENALSSIRHIDPSMQSEECRDDTNIDYDTEQRIQSSPSGNSYCPNAVLAGAQEWRRRNGREESRRAIIDFRTGKSCHNGVSRTHLHHLRGSTENLYNPPTYSSIDHPKMSSHSGLTSNRRRINASYSFEK